MSAAVRACSEQPGAVLESSVVGTLRGAKSESPIGARDTQHVSVFLGQEAVPVVVLRRRKRYRSKVRHNAVRRSAVSCADGIATLQGLTWATRPAPCAKIWKRFQSSQSDDALR